MAPAAHASSGRLEAALALKPELVELAKPAPIKLKQQGMRATQVVPTTAPGVDDEAKRPATAVATPQPQQEQQEESKEAPNVVQLQDEAKQPPAPPANAKRPQPSGPAAEPSAPNAAGQATGTPRKGKRKESKHADLAVEF